MKKTIIAMSVAMTFTSAHMSYADEAAVGLKDVVERAVITNPEIENKFHAFKASQQEKNVAKGGYYPRADVTATFREQEKPLPNVNNTDVPDRQTQLVLKQMLFDGFATRSEVRRLDHAANSRYFELQSMMQNIALEVTRNYIDVLRYRQLESYAKDNYVAHRQLFDRISERVNAGVGKRVDLEQASGRLALAEANLLTESTNLQNVNARYQRLTGELPAANLMPIGLTKDGVGASPTEALQIAFRKNPDLQGAIENIVATQSEVDGKRSKYLPRLDLQATKNLDVSDNGKNSTLAADVLQLTASINLFNGFSDKANISQSAERLNASQDFRDKACVDTRQAVVVAYNDINVLTDQLTYRNEHQQSIERAREAYRNQYDIGQRTLLDLLDTENEYFQARRAYTNTSGDLAIAIARTYASEGMLLESLGVARTDVSEPTQDGSNDGFNVCQAVAPEMTDVSKMSLADATVVAVAPVVVAKPQAPILTNDQMVCSTDTVNAKLNDWAEAWRKKDADSYLSYYAASFKPEKGLSQAAWQTQRKQRLAQAGAIALTLDDVNITTQETSASAKFVQHYVSKGYKDTVMKVITFQAVGTACQIVREEVLGN
ncbi:MAG TPA: TolC family outer membrane protein [Methylophilaceae bacterium]